MENNTKIYLIILGVLIIGVFAFFSFQDNNLVDSSGALIADLPLEQQEKDLDKEELEVENTMDEFVQCLIDKGVVVYASETCPACSSFAQMFGGYEKVKNLFVLCGEETERCISEMLTNYVPEIQVNEEVYQGQRSLEGLAEVTNCNL